MFRWAKKADTNEVGRGSNSRGLGKLIRIGRLIFRPFPGMCYWALYLH